VEVEVPPPPHTHTCLQAMTAEKVTVLVHVLEKDRAFPFVHVIMFWQSSAWLSVDTLAVCCRTSAFRTTQSGVSTW